MNTHQLNTLLLGRVPNFLGVFACDELPSILPRSFSMVVNLDVASSIGSHWISMISRSKSRLYYYDSFGRKPSNTHILRWIKEQGFRSVIYSEARSQARNESNCGAYAVYAIDRLARGVSFKKLVKNFRKMKSDDSFVRKYMLSEFDYKVPR